MQSHLQGTSLPLLSVRPVVRAALLCAASCVSVSVLAQQARLDPVVVTGVRQPLPLSRMAADVQIIDAERIANSTADSVEDLLRREAGLQVSRNGGPGMNAGILIRGAGVGNTVVLIDGVRVGSATLGQVMFESLSLAQIDRIEVLRGPASSLYGADAAGGVVQIFTRRGAPGLQVHAKAAVGGYGSRDTALGVSGAQSGFDYALSLADESTDGVSALRPGDRYGNYNPDRDGAHRTSGQLAVGFTPVAGHRIGLSHTRSRTRNQYDDSQYVAPTFAQDATPDFRNRLDTTTTALDHRSQFGNGLTWTNHLARSEDQLLTGAAVIDRFQTRRAQFTSQVGWAIDTRHHVVGAVEHLVEKASSTSYAADAVRRNDALVLGYSGSFDGTLVQADVRRDQNSVYGGVTTARLGGSVTLAPGLRLRTLAGTTYRAPSFNDLYYPGYGVATITPEHGRSVEIGLSWKDADTELSATAYRNRMRDLIAYESNRSFCPAGTAYDYGCARNVNRARLTGLTLSGEHRWGDFTLNGTIDFLDAMDVATDTRLTRRAAHQESLAGDYRLGDWTVGAAVLRVGARPDGGKVLDGYTTLDLKAHWRFAPQWRLEAKLLNATDRDVEPARDYQGLGRQGWLGVRFDGTVL
jgi:vitamin B12 transporter